MGDEKASLELQLEQSTLHKTPLTYKIYIDGKLYKSIHQTPKNGLTKLAVEIKNPTRWWPHNLGEPYPLYNQSFGFQTENTSRSN